MITVLVFGFAVSVLFLSFVCQRALCLSFWCQRAVCVFVVSQRSLCVTFMC